MSDSKIKWTGFGSYVAEVQLHFATVIHSSGWVSLHVFHGAPAARSWWRSVPSLVTWSRQDDGALAARAMIDTLSGVAGGWRSFPVYTINSMGQVTLLENP